MAAKKSLAVEALKMYIHAAKRLQFFKRQPVRDVSAIADAARTAKTAREIFEDELEKEIGEE